MPSPPRPAHGQSYPPGLFSFNLHDQQQERQIYQQMVACEFHAQAPSEYAAARGLQDRDQPAGVHGPLPASPIDEEVTFYENPDRGNDNQQASDSSLKWEDDDPVSSPPPQSDGYCPGWTPEASFDWGVDISSGEDRLEGKGK